MEKYISTKPTQKDGRVKNLKAENKKLLDEVSKLRNEIKSFKESNKVSCNMLHKQSDIIRELKSNICDLKDEHNNHMEVAENEIKRLNQIIFYLETKCLKVFE